MSNIENEASSVDADGLEVLSPKQRSEARSFAVRVIPAAEREQANSRQAVQDPAVTQGAILVKPPSTLECFFRHFIEEVRGVAGIVYGRRMYDVMRYWDKDLPDWVADEQEFAAEWRRQPK